MRKSTYSEMVTAMRQAKLPLVRVPPSRIGQLLEGVARLKPFAVAGKTSDCQIELESGFRIDVHQGTILIFRNDSLFAFASQEGADVLDPNRDTAEAEATVEQINRLVWQSVRDREEKADFSDEAESN